MASAETLELLDKIVRGAEAAADKEPGAPLRAAEWNTLAEAIARLARLAAARERDEAEALDRTYARADHGHLGAVTIAWFDAPTRKLIEERAGATDAAARLTALERGMRALEARMTELLGQVDRLRDGLTVATDAQRVRDRAAERLNERLTGVLDLERRVSAVDQRFATLDTRMQQALAFADTLKDATGAPVNIAALDARVINLLRTQERLKLADGEVVRMLDVERRIAALEDNTLTDKTVDSKIGIRLEAMAADPDSPLTRRTAEAVTATLDPRITVLEAGLTTTRTEAEGLIAGRATDRTRLGAIEAGLAQQASALQALGATVSPLPGRVASLETASADASRRLAQVDALSTEVSGLRDTTRTLQAFGPRLDAVEASDRTQTTRLTAVERNVAPVADLSTRVAAVERSTADLAAQTGRIATVERDLGALTTRVQATETATASVGTLTNRVAAVERSQAETTAWRGTVDRRLADVPDRTVINDLQGRVSVVETRTAENTTQINNLSRDRIVREPVGGVVREPVGGVVRDPVRPR